MPITRVTISMPSALARKVKRAAGKQPVSAWLTELVEERLTRRELDQMWSAHVASFAFTAAETREARRRLSRLTRPKRRRAA